MYLFSTFAWPVGSSDQADLGRPRPPRQSLNQVDEVAEEGDDESGHLNSEAAQSKKSEKFEKLYGAALEKGIEEGREEYKSFEHGAVEELGMYTIRLNLSLPSDLVGLASEHLKRFWYTGQCRRDYSLPCPNGWSQSETTKACTAPEDYEGPCESSKDFSRMDETAREDYAWRCHVSWPCINATPIDPEAVCPQEWTKLSGYICIAPAGYDGICPPIWSLHGLSVLDKSAYEQLCGVRWPRKPTEPEYPLNLGFGKGYAAVGGSEWLSGAIGDTGTVVPPI
ncbi:CPW-WPC domain-containing protein [Babesia caballi]|uniref:CPW-WPC domain-containing protein n=1 Tax=Babesia caballi TaxID=5871 RepID=A0AAV4LMK7_BABCB|nr:CPW-WPC domain-containing protein [Babesia caballi]